MRSHQECCTDPGVTSRPKPNAEHVWFHHLSTEKLVHVCLHTQLYTLLVTLALQGSVNGSLVINHITDNLSVRVCRMLSLHYTETGSWTRLLINHQFKKRVQEEIQSRVNSQVPVAPVSRSRLGSCEDRVFNYPVHSFHWRQIQVKRLGLLDPSQGVRFLKTLTMMPRSDNKNV